MRRATLPLALLLGSCASGGAETIATYQPAAGSNEVLRGDIVAAPGHQLVTADIVLPAHGEVPLHYHHGEEFLYVLEGSATLTIMGEQGRVLQAGDAVRIAPTMLHDAIAGPDGLRAVASWIVPEGRPLRVQPMIPLR